MAKRNIASDDSEKNQAVEKLESNDEPKLDIIDAGLLERHAKYRAMFRQSLAQASIALMCIKAEKTYVVDGYARFDDFVADELSMSRHYADVLATEGKLFSLLEDNPELSDVLDAITSTEQLRPIYKMAPERQVRVLQLAVEKAPRTIAKRPQLSGRLVADVAEQHFGWTKKKKAKRQSEEREKPQGLRALERAFKAIAECGLTPELAVETYGDPSEWEYRANATEWLRQVQRLSES